MRQVWNRDEKSPCVSSGQFSDMKGAATIDDRVLDSLAHRACDAAEHDVDLTLLNELANVTDSDLRVRGGIFEIKLDRAAEDSAAR